METPLVYRRVAAKEILVGFCEVTDMISAVFGQTIGRAIALLQTAP